MKKNIIVFVITIFSVINIFAQDYEYDVQIYNTKGKVYPNVKIWFINKSTGEQIVKYTDTKGEAKFKLTSSGLWSLNLIGLHDYQIIKLNQGVIGQGTQVITYDLEQILAEQEFRRKRILLTYAYIDQTNIKIPSQVSNGFATVTVFLKGNNGELYKGIPVSLVSVKDQKIYFSATDKTSCAKFVVPNDQMYGIDVEDAKNLEFTGDITNATTARINIGFTPTNIVEHVVKDTITQEIEPNVEPTSTRTSVTLKIVGGPDNFYSNEVVFLSQINSPFVYKGVTDNNGEVSFLIPNGNAYMINFRFQYNVDVINLKDSYGLRTIRKQIIYTPLPELEHPEDFIPLPNELFLVNLNSLQINSFSDDKNQDILDLQWGNDNVNSTSKESVLQMNLLIGSKDDKVNTRTNLAFVIDKSGSMCGDNRIDALKQSLIDYVGNLPVQDNIAIITFNDQAFLDSELKPVGGNSMLVPIISDIEADGGTDIYNGLIMGYEQLLKNYDKNRNNILILFSDGYGTHPIDSVIAMSKSYNDKGIQISVVGVGEDYNKQLLDSLTSEDASLFQHAGNSEDISNTFDNQLTGLLTPVGKDAKIEIFYNNKIKLNKVFGVIIDNKSNNIATINIGNIYEGKRLTLLMNFDLSGIDNKIDKVPVKIRFSYKNSSDEIVVIEKDANLKWNSDDNSCKLIVNENVKDNYSIVIMNKAITQMSVSFANGDIQNAKQSISDCKKYIDEISPDMSVKYISDLYSKVLLYNKAIDNYIKNKNNE